MLAKIVTLAAATALWATTCLAQDRAWIQVEAQPTLTGAEDRARAYASAFPDVVGYQLGSRWYGIALGPQERPAAEDRMRSLKAAGEIPQDSFISDGSNFRDQFWPVGPAAGVQPETAPKATPETQATAEAGTSLTPEAAPDAARDPGAAAMAAVEAQSDEPEETPSEARRSEALLSTDERMDLQRALQWEGFYASAIDGAFGPGTRRSMADWQTAMGFEPTGVLTARQRALLLTNWKADLADFGLETVTEAEAGIEVTLPLGLVAFDHYEPPFVHFSEKNGSGLRVILISQPGDQSSLYGLYDILQTLTIIPMEGERSRGERSFEIKGANGTIASHAQAELSRGLIKGFILVWNPEQAGRAERVLATMKASFRAVGDRALDPGMVPMTEGARKGLLSGLELRRPKLSRSGFYLDGTGHVATTAEAVAQCGRITLDGATEADLLISDAASGVAILTPRGPLAPPIVGALQIAPDRVGAEIAVSGYSYEDTLPAPVLTFGTLEDLKGLNGETGVKRLGIATLPGDAGGPVIDGTGAVLGMLLPRTSDGSRILPVGVEFAAASATIAQLLRANGLGAEEASASGALAPEDLTRKAMGMTVLVGCWE